MSLVLSEFWLQIFISFAITAIASLSLYVCFIGGQFSLGHGSLMAAGSYSAALVSIKTDQPFAVSLASAVVGGAAVGLVMGLMALRIQEFYLAIGTLAFGAAAIVMVINSDTLGGPTGLVGISLETTGNIALLMLVVATAAVLCARHSRFGRALLALREDERLAATAGIRVWALKLGCFAFSGAIAGLAGGLLAHNLAIVRPEGYELELSLSLWVTVIVGGTATVAGPLVGSFIVVLLTEWVSSKIEIDHLYIEGGLLVLAMLVRPNGLIGTGDLRRAWNLVHGRRSKPAGHDDDGGTDAVSAPTNDEPRPNTALEVGRP
jgi:branched-chain amino acid transport system permease protein